MFCHRRAGDNASNCFNNKRTAAAHVLEFELLIQTEDFSKEGLIAREESVRIS
jgi:hypothetical protein